MRQYLTAAIMGLLMSCAGCAASQQQGLPALVGAANGALASVTETQCRDFATAHPDEARTVLLAADSVTTQSQACAKGIRAGLPTP